MSLHSVVTLSSSLKSYTALPHVSLEKLLVKRLKNISSHADYISVLQLMYGYYHPLEKLIGKEVDIQTSSRKASWILEDLHNLGNSFHNLPECTDLPVISTEAEALGALYVLEGSTLGGVHIAAMISKKIPSDFPLSLRFFQGYGPATKQSWEHFCTGINEKKFSTEEKEQVLATAAQTFILFEKWIRENEPGTDQ